MQKEKKRIRPVVEEIIPDSVEKTDSMEGKKEEVKNEEIKNKEAKIIEPEKNDNLVVDQKADSPLTTSKESSPQIEDTYKEKTNFLTLFILTIGVALLVAISAGGIYVYLNGIKSLDEEKDIVSQEQILETPLPEVTEEQKEESTKSGEIIDKDQLSKLKVSILNGSGKIGAAGAVKTIIEKEGFKVVNTGNASNFNFKQTQISAKESVSQEIVDLLNKSLESKYKLEKGTVLESKSLYDIVITVGLE